VIEMHARVSIHDGDFAMTTMTIDEKSETEGFSRDGRNLKRNALAEDRCSRT